VVVFAALLLSGATCQQAEKDGLGTGDERIDEPTTADRSSPDAGSPTACTASPPGNLILLDARTAAPLNCELVTVSREPQGCGEGQQCDPLVLVRGRTNSLGQVSIQLDPATVRLSAVAEGYSVSYREPAPVAAGQKAEIELQPSDGYLLKILDSEGNYLSRVQVTFRQGEEAIASMRTNDLANVFFGTRAPFAGQPVTIEVEGFAPVTVSGPGDLGPDRHTVTVRK